AGVQKGTVTVYVTAETYDVTFDANGSGAKVSGAAVTSVAGLYFVPKLEQIIPVRDNYAFKGWFTDKECTKTMDSDAVLVSDVTFYAKWEPIQSISGTIQVDASGVRPACKPSNIVVQLVRYDGVPHPFKTTTVAVTWTGENDTVGTAAYEFTGLNALGSEDHYYQIQINEINYTTYYSNEPSNGEWSSTNAAFSKAVFSSTTPTATYVKAQLAFTPDTFTQEVRVDATSIGEGYRPNNVKTRFMYVRQGTTDVQPAYVHSATDGGIIVGLAADGTGSATEGGLRKRAWNEDRTQVVLYDYNAKVTQVGGADFVESNPYYTASYGNSIHWIQAENRSSGILEVKLTPKTYNINYVLNGGTLAAGSPEKHTWSYTTNVAAATRDGYIFLGWTADDASITSGTSVTIPAELAKDVTLTAHWTLDENRDGTPDNQQVFIKYVAGAGGYIKDNVTSEAITLGGVSAVGAKAVADPGYAFDGWTLTSTGDVNAATYTATNPALTPTFTNEAAGKTYTFTAKFAVSNNGDDIPDYKQGFIVFEAGANGSLEGTTKQAFNLTGSGSGYSGTVTPEIVTPKAVSGFAFDYWSIDGTTKVDPFKPQTLIGNQTVTYTAHFAEDVNNDGTPDQYQKLVKFQIVNGTWNLDGKPTEKTYFVNLNEDGKANIQSLIPEAIAKEGYTNSTWSPKPSDNGYVVSGLEPVTYTLRFDAYNYKYQIDHMVQQLDGSYQMDEPSGQNIKTLRLNAENNGFEAGQIISVTNHDLRDYGDHYKVGSTTTAAPVYGTADSVQTTPAVLKVYYDLDEHTVTYDSNGGSDVSSVTRLCGNTVTVAGAPIKEDSTFDGWKVISGEAVGTIYSTGASLTLNEDVTLQAQWRVDENNDGIADETQVFVIYQATSGGAVSSTGEAVEFSGETANAEAVTAEAVAKYAFDGWTLTSGAAANVTYDPTQKTLAPIFGSAAAGQTYV
ncbi:MAG: InlB B-repeat-containing protein, partial [Firmicutes bacterium]|nr:InlB B-repeat-containing protein [Bacillota bacterium]